MVPTLLVVTLQKVSVNSSLSEGVMVNLFGFRKTEHQCAAEDAYKTDSHLP